MTPSEAVKNILNPALAWLPKHMDTPRARVMLLAIALQESELTHRVQMGGGPARSLWQFELGTKISRGGVWGIYQHEDSRDLLRAACEDHGVMFEPRAIWTAITTDDVLACICARLLLWTDALPLPQLDDVQGAWELYKERTWRPGKPHREKWPRNHALAVAEVTR